MCDPIFSFPVFSFINSAFKLSEVALAICEVGSENEVFVRTIQRVRRDLEETERLIHISSIASVLISTPGKLPWIKDVLLSTKKALDDIGRWVDRARADKIGFGSVSFENRIRWVFNDREKVSVRRMELGACHQALLTVLAYLIPLEALHSDSSSEPPRYDDIASLEGYLSPRQRRLRSKDVDVLVESEEIRDGIVIY